LSSPQEGLYVNDLNDGTHTVRSTPDANTQVTQSDQYTNGWVSDADLECN
jgi:hypothetical protein